MKPEKCETLALTRPASTDPMIFLYSLTAEVASIFLLMQNALFINLNYDESRVGICVATPYHAVVG